MLRFLSQFILALLLATSTGAADKLPAYDEMADADRDIAAAIQQAATQKKLVLLVFGANWCPDCRALEDEMNAPDLGTALALNYVTVKVDVARFKKNLDVAARYGVVVKRGIPALGIVNADGKKVVAADGRQVEELRKAGKQALIKYLEAGLTAEKSASSQ
jgi:thioredoxin 1